MGCSLLDLRLLAVCLTAASLVASVPVDNVSKRQADANATSVGHWDLVKEVIIAGSVPLRKYVSRKTGLTVVVASAESPIVNGFFCLPTEANTNDGLPHTLEHLIFLGSEDYPYKEVLDLLANRCLSERTNAWTDTDHTCYTIYTAGTGGFLNILPVYMDHILYPTLRDEDFLTEVHHISGTGEDGGVVYSEMQGTETSAASTVYFNTIDSVYPGPSPYEMRTGGALKNLRENTTIAKVRDYHRKFYQPKNVHITVTGSVKPEEIFAALAPVEDKVVAKGESYYPPYVRPFESNIAPLDANLDRVIKFPSDSEDTGYVSLAWRLPEKLWQQLPLLRAVKAMNSYLSSSSASPMADAFVNLVEPLASDLTMSLNSFAEPVLMVHFDHVPVGKMDTIEPTFRAALDKIIAAGPEKFDLNRLHTLIRRKVLQTSMSLENSPHSFVPDKVVQDMIYGHSPDDLENFLGDGMQKDADELLKKPAQFWIDLIKSTFSTPRVRIQFYPSKALDEEMQRNETARIEKQRADLGPEGLAKEELKLKEAVDSQKLPPQDVLLKIPMGDVDKIAFRHLTAYNATSPTQPAGFDLQSLPFRFHLDDINSQFVRYFLFFNASSLAQEDRAYLPLLNEVWLQSPVVKADGTELDLKSVVERRANETLSFTSYIGYKGGTYTPGSQSELVVFFAETLMDNYEAGLNLVNDTLFRVKFTPERTQALVSQLLQALPALKLKASTVVDTISDEIYFNNRTNVHHASFLRQQKFLQGVLEKLKTNPNEVISTLDRLRKEIVQPKNLFAYLATDAKTLTSRYGSKATELWASLVVPGSELTPKEDLKLPYKIPSEYQFVDSKPEHKHAIAGIPGTESCYLRQSVAYPTTDWEATEVAAVRVMLQYLTDQMYQKIRGRGLTYGINLSGSITEGRISVKFTRSSRLDSAYAVFREIIANYTAADAPWDAVLLDSAKGSQIYNWAEREETVEDLANVSVQSILRDSGDPLYNRRFVKRIAEVTLDDVKSAADKYLKHFLSADDTQTAVTCGPNQVDTVKKALAAFGFDLFVITDLENSFVAK